MKNTITLDEIMELVNAYGRCEVQNNGLKADEKLAEIRKAIEAIAQPAGEAGPVAEVVWYDPTPIALSARRSGKIIDASMAFFDNHPVGTKLYTAHQQSQPPSPISNHSRLRRPGSLHREKLDRPKNG